LGHGLFVLVSAATLDKMIVARAGLSKPKQRAPQYQFCRQQAVRQHLKVAITICLLYICMKVPR
jgi:hypothetical protein